MEGQSTSPAINHKKDTVGSILVDLERDIERLAKLGDTIHFIGDRVDGGRPEPVAAEGPDIPSTSMIVDLRRKHTTISSLIGRCEDEVQRVIQALGISQ